MCLSVLVDPLLSAQDKKLALECKPSLLNTLLSPTNIFFFGSKTLLMKEAVHWLRIGHEFLISLYTENKHFIA